MESSMDKQRKKPTKFEELTKEQIKRALQKKRESNAKAQRIVENLLEKNVTESYFLECLYDINQSHFEDVIEERSITHICGYPLCDKSISKNDIPKQKYRIDVRKNKIYDISCRKSFCSNLCYNSAMYVKNQMFKSPLWYREYENIPTFHLMSMDTDPNVSLSMGQEIDVSIIEKIDVTDPPTFTSINDFARASLHEMVCDEETNDEQCKPQQEGRKNDQPPVCTDRVSPPVINSQQEISHNSNNEDISAVEIKRLDPKMPLQKPQESKLRPGIIGEIVEWPVCEVDPILDKPCEKQAKSTKKVQKKKQPELSTIIKEVEKCLEEWFTLDSMLFLLGEERVREMVTDKRECFKEYMNNYSKSRFHSSNSYDQYLTLCRKLNMLELEDKKFDSKAMQRETKPLPDYTMIQEESKRMQLKVITYLDGKTEVPEPLHTEPNTSNEDGLTQLPLLDKNSQNALRRRIVHQHLNKFLPDLLRSLGLVGFSINTEAKLLVNTFKLSAHNIMFKPIQWTLISIILLKLLALRDRHLEYKLKEPTAFQHMHLILLSYMLDGGYLDRLLYWLTDLDRLLGSNDDMVD